MAAYVIADVEVADPETFRRYRELAVPTVGQYGGKALVVDGRFEVLEGSLRPKQLVVIEFESMEQAKRWYESQEYGQAMPLRQRSATTNLLLVEGLPETATAQ